ncbi:MAG: hypothetical protein KAG66_22515, partial [Methylococcales bacterium]|nr:hypothetical protein [Methylococcales bacterium]
NIAPTLIVLDEIREQLGFSIRMTNTYRSPEYNEANYIRSKARRVDKARKAGQSLTFDKAYTGVGKSSQHMVFRAIDFKIDGGSLAEAYRIAQSLRGETFDLPIPLRMSNPVIRKMKYVGGSKVSFSVNGLRMTDTSFVFRGGLHLYPKFIHIDCRGNDSSW